MSLRKGRPISKQGINHHNKCHIYSRNYKYSNEFTSPHGSSSASNIWRKLWVAVTILYNQNTTISYLYELNKNGGQAPVDEDTIMAPPDKSTLYKHRYPSYLHSQREMCNGYNWRACNESDSSNNCIAYYRVRLITLSSATEQCPYNRNTASNPCYWECMQIKLPISAANTTTFSANKKVLPMDE